MKLRRLAVATAAAIGCMSAAVAVQTPYRLTVIHAPSAGVDVTVDVVGADYFVALDDVKSIPRLRPSLIHTIAGRPGIVKLSDLGQVTLDELNGELHLAVRPELLEPQVLGASPSFDKLKLPSETPMNALVGDYDLRFDTSTGQTKFGVMSTATAWLFGNRIDGSLVAGTGIQTQVTKLRLVREDLSSSSLLEAGTITAASGSRSSPGQIVGVGMRRDRGVTPGFITGPQLRVDGVSRAQSTVDVLIDNQRVQHTTQPGPFTVIANPVGNGGQASVIVRDDLGQERLITAQLWANPSLLGIGQSEYALSAGRVSRGGLSSDGPVVAGYYRQGQTNWLTAEVGFEATKEYRRATTAADMATSFGDFSLDLAMGGGRSIAGRYSLPAASIGKWAISGGAQISASSKDYLYAGGGIVSANSRSQRGLSASATREGWSVNTTLAATPAGMFWSGSISHRLNAAGASLNVTAIRFNDYIKATQSSSIFVGFSLPIFGRFASFSAANTSEGVRKQASFGGSVTDELSVSVSADGIHEVERVGAEASFSVGALNTNLGVSKPNGKTAAYRGSVRSGFIAYPGGVASAAAGSSDSGFVVVDLGAPGVEVLNGLGGRRTTGGDGTAVLRIPSLQNARVTIDPSSAPDGLDLDPFTVVVGRRAGVLVKRSPVVSNGRFIQIAGARPGDVLSLGGQQLPITDRGVWVDLEKGTYEGILGDAKTKLVVE